MRVWHLFIRGNADADPELLLQRNLEDALHEMTRGSRKLRPGGFIALTRDGRLTIAAMAGVGVRFSDVRQSWDLFRTYRDVPAIVADCQASLGLPAAVALREVA